MIKNIIIAILLIVITVLGVASVYKDNSLAGGTTNLDTVSITGLQVGSATTTTIGTILAGSMNCSPASTSVTTFLATTTTSLDCSVTGARVNDNVFVTLASTTPSWLVLSSAYASSAADYIRVAILNASTSSQTINTNSTSSLRYWIVR